MVLRSSSPVVLISMRLLRKQAGAGLTLQPKASRPLQQLPRQGGLHATG